MSEQRLLSRKSWPYAVVVIVCAAAVVAVLTGATGPLPATLFANTGHWVYNSALSTVFHVDGATTNIDAHLKLDADPRSQVLASDTSGFVVGTSRITRFDKASQSTQKPVRPPSDEVPLGMEVVGGPYAVYRNAGTIVRLGDPAAVVPAGGAIGDPVVTDDGTMWFNRIGKGSICRLDKGAVRIAGCPVSAPAKDPGAMTIVGGRPAFVDLFTSRLHTISGTDFGAGLPLGVRLSPNSRPAAQDTDGRLAILDPGRSNLVLVDTRTRPATVVTKALPRGDYAGPVSTGDVIALVDRQKHVVLTFGADGASKDKKPIEQQKAGEPRLSSGEDDRIYVEDGDGTEVLVVDKDGDVKDVDVAPKPDKPDPGDTPGHEPGPAGPPATGSPQPGHDSPGPGEHQGPPGPNPGQDKGKNQGPPPPLPPSRPGAPLAVAAVAGNGSATVTWQPAPDNRAPITGYQVTWPGGSVNLAPNALRVVANGLTNGVAYTFTVTATNAVGTGPGASSAPVTPTAPAPTISISRGAPTTTSNCHAPNCAWVNATMAGFAPNTTYPIRLSSTSNQNVQTESFPSDAAGGGSYNELDYDVPGETVWISIQTPSGWVESNRIPWTGAAATPVVTVTKGALTDQYCTGQPGCAWMHVTLTGCQPGTAYHLEPHSNGGDGYFNGGHTSTTDANGAADVTDVFAFAGPGESVWVDVFLDADRNTVIAESKPYVW